MPFANPDNDLGAIRMTRDRPSPYKPSSLAWHRFPPPYVQRVRFRDGDGRNETRVSIRISFKCREQFCDAHLVRGILACPTF